MRAPERVPFVDLSRLVARVRDGALADWEACLAACELVGGPRVTALEAKVGAALGGPRVVACANGTDALLVALQARGVRPGTKVALPNLTFWATFEAVAQLGAVPVLVDIDPDDLQMSLAELRAAHEAHRFGAAVLVHLYGWASARLAEIRAFCEEREIALVEDAAQAFGVEALGAPVLAGASVATLSFYPSKVVGGAMDGGAIVLRDAATEATARSLCNHGRAGPYAHTRVGWNSRMSAMQAAYVSRVIDLLPELLADRRASAEWYRARLGGERRVRVYGPPAGVVENGYLDVVTVAGKDGASLARELEGAGVGCARVYPETIAAQPPARAAGAIAHGELRVSRAFCERVVSLPLFYGIREDEREAASRALVLSAACAPAT